MPTTRLTMLNSMASLDFEQSLEQQVAWEIEILDLKDRIFHQNVTELDGRDLERAQELIRQCELDVYCLSTALMLDKVELGEQAFKAKFEPQIEKVLANAKLLKPTMIRLLAAETGKRRELDNAIPYLMKEHPWIFDFYRKTIERLNGEGYRVCIENEIGGCIFSKPVEVLEFFEALKPGDKTCFTWDVQNMWQMGTPPSLDVYEQLKPLIGYYHLKGGQQAADSDKLEWASGLEQATWPVVEITKKVVEDGVSPVICLNPSHGKRRPGYDYNNVVQSDIEFIRREVPGIEGVTNF